MVTAAEWRDPAFQGALVQAHREGGGWALLEEPLLCSAGLRVAEGKVQIDGAAVNEVGHTNGSQQLRGVYPAMNYLTQVAWTTTAPALGDKWTVKSGIAGDPPCLFVQVRLFFALSRVPFFLSLCLSRICPASI